MPPEEMASSYHRFSFGLMRWPNVASTQAAQSLHAMPWAAISLAASRSRDIRSLAPSWAGSVELPDRNLVLFIMSSMSLGSTV